MTRHDPSPDGLRPRDHNTERLLSLLENAHDGSRELDEQIAAHLKGATVVIQRDGSAAYFSGGSWVSVGPIKAYTTSLDAALTLVPKGMGYGVKRENDHDYAWCNGDIASEPGREPYVAVRYGVTPAIALCIAALKARAQASKSAPSVALTPDRGASTS